VPSNGETGEPLDQLPDDPAEQLRAEPDGPGRSCQGCGGVPRWESLYDGWGERWLAVCACGRIETFFPDRRHPEQQSTDPLTHFLQGHLRPRRAATSPWARLFLTSVQAPWSVRWRHDPSGCPMCEAQTSFGLLAWPRPFTAAICTLCLNCGYTTTSYSNPSAGTSEPLLDGTAWTPPCPAVKRLRACVFLTTEYARWTTDQPDW
jgi:hypothetical protein